MADNQSPTLNTNHDANDQSHKSLQINPSNPAITPQKPKATSKVRIAQIRRMQETIAERTKGKEITPNALAALAAAWVSLDTRRDQIVDAQAARRLARSQAANGKATAPGNAARQKHGVDFEE